MSALQEPGCIAFSPVDLEVIDPLGRLASKTTQQIPGSEYFEGLVPPYVDTPVDGLLFSSSGWVDGHYLVRVVPETSADPSATFTLMFFDPRSSEGRLIALDQLVGQGVQEFSFETSAIPEPSTLALLLLSGAAALGRSRHRSRRSQARKEASPQV